MEEMLVEVISGRHFMSKFCFLIYALLFFYIVYNKYIIFIVRKPPHKYH